jgi:pyruvate-formate lyase-activating enzyme
MIHPEEMPRMVYANAKGEILDLPDLEMAGRSGTHIRRPELFELIPLPQGSLLFMLPGRYPVGIDPRGGRPIRVTQTPPEAEGPITAVGAFMAPAYTAIYSAAFEKADGEVPVLPLFAYTAVGWHKGRFWVAAFRCDPDPRQDADRFDYRRIEEKTQRQMKRVPQNRLIQHLGKCSLVYRCPAACNYFLGRWEAPVPTSPACNADCLGCISLQTSGCCPAPQERIAFVPTPEEIGELVVPHLQKAPRPVASFGQGCEGEPLLQAEVIETAIRKIRKETSRGTINLNTNASLPDRLDRLARAGLDSIRVSLNSARKDPYTLYYRPRGYSFDEVIASIAVMKKRKRFVSLNYFILPGFTDDPEEMAALMDLLARWEPELIQLRNLNMDPDLYLEGVKHRAKGEPVGILHWLKTLKKNFPRLRFGYFNPYLGGRAAQ